ncbi:hypothetical protein N7533_006423 [Penicillium manginii]|uniref:uncharacterized protein n=1 Tax=Penicillium manginii TaxID=203109 RepID=UPI002548E925|nr:uncharacterized protein N7533_006423 [Penicillium manginii]KAJ5749395.1 hypothetical protein N7533_006423 [Penicillium manginii]
MLDSAISSIAVNFANEQITAAIERNLPSHHKEKMLKNVRAITVDQIKCALRDIFLPIFAPKTANLVVICATMLEEATKQGFEASGFTPTVQPLKRFEDDYGLKAGDQNEDED